MTPLKQIVLCWIFIAPALFATVESNGEVLARGGRGGSNRKSSSTRVRGYTKRSGKYVAPHMRTSPNRMKRDNWSTKGNVNPYTGKQGTKNPW
jgi:hypothetical protein